MKRFVLAALLALPFVANALCYVHPETHRTYCYSAAECPANTAWNAQTQECRPNAPPPPAPVTVEGEYTPGVLLALGTTAFPNKAYYIRQGQIVTVFGSVNVVTAATPRAAVYLTLPGNASGHGTVGTIVSLAGAVGIVVESGGGPVLLSWVPTSIGADLLNYSYSFRVWP